MRLGSLQAAIDLYAKSDKQAALSSIRYRRCANAWYRLGNEAMAISRLSNAEEQEQLGY